MRITGEVSHEITLGGPRSIRSSNCSMSADHRNGLRAHFRAVRWVDRGAAGRVKRRVGPLEPVLLRVHRTGIRPGIEPSEKLLDPIGEFVAGEWLG